MSVTNLIVGYKLIPIELIRPFHAGNPRAMDDEQSRMLGRTIDDIGFAQPVIVRMIDDDPVYQYEIIDGHHRVEALKDAGETKIPCVIIEMDDEVKARALTLGINRIAADWNTESLNKYIAEISALGADTDWLADVSGMRHDDGLEAFKDLSTDFLDEFKNDAISGADEGGIEDDTDEGIAPGDVDADDAEQALVPLTFNLTPGDRKRVTQALRAVQQREDGPGKNVEALLFLCDSYMANIGDDDTTDEEDEE